MKYKEILTLYGRSVIPIAEIYESRVSKLKDEIRRFEITTNISSKGLIVQKLMDEKTNELSRWVCDTRESGIKAALIKLGWIPPNDKGEKP